MCASCAAHTSSIATTVSIARLAVQAYFLVCHDAACMLTTLWQKLVYMKTFELTSDATAVGTQNVLSDAESDIADCPHRLTEFID